MGLPELKWVATLPRSSRQRCSSEEYRSLQDVERSLQGEVAIVTGVSRSQGIGGAISRELAALGANLFLTGWPASDEGQPGGSAIPDWTDS
jgi:hypothetical protein